MHKLFICFGDFRICLHNEQAGIHICDGRGNAFHHVIAEGVLRLDEARRIDEHLRFALCPHAHNARAGGLWLIGNDGKLRTEQAVQNRGFAHVRSAHNGDKRRFFVHVVFCIHSFPGARSRGFLSDNLYHFL